MIRDQRCLKDLVFNGFQCDVTDVNTKLKCFKL